MATIADTGGDRRVAPTCSAESADPPKLSRHEWWALTAFCAVALALTMADLGARSLWVDELHTAFVAASRGRSLWDASTFDGGNMLAYYAFMNLWVHVFGTSPVALRLPSAIAGAGLVPVGYLLGRRSGGMKPGAAAALLLAVSPPLVVWAQQARGYSIAVVGVGLAWLALLRARALPSVPRLCLFVALSVACTYELLTASLVVAAGLLWLFFGTSERRLQLQTLACGAAYAICCVPLALVVHRSGVSGQVAWVAPPDLGSARAIAGELVGGSVPDFYPSHLANYGLAAIVIASALFALAVSLRARTSGRDEALGHRRMYSIEAGYLLWLLLPVALAWLVSEATGDSIFGSSFLLPAVPGAVLLFAAGIGRVHQHWLAVSGTVAAAALSLSVLLPVYGHSDDDWSAAARYVLASARPHDCIAFDSPPGAALFGYYVERLDPRARSPVAVLPQQTWQQAAEQAVQYSETRDYEPAAFSRIERTCGRLWIILDRVHADEGFAEAEIQFYLHDRFVEVHHAQFTGMDVDLLGRR
ncbi:MAG: hypothetical protein ACLQK4_06630 [Acidimicrobiales bacterium]